LLRFLPIALVVALAACGSSGTKTVTVVHTVTVTTPTAGTTTVRVYFLRDGKIAPFARTLQTTKAVATAALQQLVTGLTTENAAANVTNPLPKGAGFSGLRIVNGVASVEASGDFSGAALADVVYTLTQFRNVNTVEI